jgi:hypothetical protein
MGASEASKDESSPLRRIGWKNANKPVAGPSFLGLFYGGFKLGRWANNNRRAALQ